MRQKLSNYERETIINFNEGEAMASIFTYNRTWQKHLEKRLGLKPTLDNGFGGRGYEIPKKRIRPPRAPRKLSPEAKAKLTKRLSNSRQKSILRSQNNTTTRKSNTKNRNKGKSINQQPRLLGE